MVEYQILDQYFIINRLIEAIRTRTFQPNRSQWELNSRAKIPSTIKLSVARGLVRKMHNFKMTSKKQEIIITLKRNMGP